MNVYEKYLSVDEVAGGQLALRGDSEEVGFAERFWVKVQHKYKMEAHEEERKKKMEAHVIEPDIDEAATKYVCGALSAECTGTDGRLQSPISGLGSWPLCCLGSIQDGRGSHQENRQLHMLTHVLQLKKARKEGKLAETLLDRRIKLKRWGANLRLMSTLLTSSSQRSLLLTETGRHCGISHVLSMALQQTTFWLICLMNCSKTANQGDVASNQQGTAAMGPIKRLCTFHRPSRGRIPTEVISGLPDRQKSFSPPSEMRGRCACCAGSSSG
jgi:hypothetical protein